MTTSAQAKDVVQAYVTAFNGGDADAVARLFAENAALEDPVGIVAASGHPAIRAFYTPVIVGTGATMALTGSIRANGGDVAFPVHVSTTIGGKSLELDVIDVFRIDGDGRIASMKAYFDPAEVAAQVGA